MRRIGWLLGLLMASCVFDASARADPPLVYPGMPIRQGTLSCTLGFVETKLRIGITAGHCFSGDGTVRAGDGTPIGRKVLAHDNRPDEGPVYADEYAIDYEAIAFDDGVQLNDILTNGRRLERDDSVIPVLGMSICRLGVTTGDACGSITRLGNGWFRFDGPVIDKGDSGGPVYTTVGERTVLIGIIRGFITNRDGGNVQSWAMSWPSVVSQLREDRAQLLPAAGS